MSTALEPTVIKGGLSIDDRGELFFANEFHFEGLKRFYMVKNHKAGFIRAWHGHKNEGKRVICVQGSALVCAIKIDNWDKPSKESKIHRFVVSEKSPSVVMIPPGYANGFMSLTEDAKLLFLSTSTLEESMKDDVRFDSKYWNPWHVEER